MQAMRSFYIIVLLIAPTHAEDWPQYRGPKRDGVWRENGIIENFDEASLAARVKWRVPISNGYSGPTVADGRVFVTDRVREPKQQEQVHCFDWKSGRQLWSFAYDCMYRGISYEDGPRACVTVASGRAYALGAMGNLHCLDTRNGKVLWARDLNAEYKIRMPMWGIAAAPLIEGDLVILHIGGENACIIALDRKTGKERWRALEDGASYSAPIIVEQGKQRVLVCWVAHRVVGLNPKTGELLWAQDFPQKPYVVCITSPVSDGEKLFICSATDGSLMLRLPPDKPAVEKLWHRRGQSDVQTDALHSLISTPIFRGDNIYGIDHYGALRCLDAKNGDRLWENLTIIPKARWATAHLTPNRDKTWIFTERGVLILARLTPQGYEEISRAPLLKPTRGQLPERGGVCWSPPAYANRHIFVRNDEELLCVNLSVEKQK